MDPEFVRKRIIQAARENAPSDRVPYAFRKRVISNLPIIKPLEMWNIWSHMLWKAAAPCMGFALLFSACSFYFIEKTSDEIFGAELEETMFSALEVNGEIW